MNFKKIIKSFVLLTFCIFTVTLTSCGSSRVEGQKPSVQNLDKMFWAVNGWDAKGKPSTVYLFGTIHVGKQDLFPLSETVTKAFDKADRYAAEISSEDMKRMTSETIKLLTKSAIASNGRDIKTELSQEQWAVIEKNLGSGAQIYSKFEPWVINTTLVQNLYKTSGLSQTYGIDFNLMAELTKKKKAWEGLDELETQLNILCFGTYDEQLWVLKQDIDMMINPEEINTFVNRLYEAYISGDTDTLYKISQEEPGKDDPAMKEFVDQYQKALITDRNQNWTHKINDYLYKGGKTFIFAGAQHFSGEDSVFRYLKEYGYTE